MSTFIKHSVIRFGRSGNKPETDGKIPQTYVDHRLIFEFRIIPGSANASSSIPDIINKSLKILAFPGHKV